MSIYRCAACGSPNVKTDTQKEGFSYTKAAIGTVVLGAGGAVAGIDGKSTKVFKCPDCGLTMSHPMPDEIRQIIDIGVISLDARNNLELHGTKMSWDLLKQEYKNIESGMADQTLADRERQKVNRINAASGTQEEFDQAIDFLKDIYDRYGDGSKQTGYMTLEEYKETQQAINILGESIMKYLPKPLPNKYRKLPSYAIEYFLAEYLIQKGAEVLGMPFRVNCYTTAWMGSSRNMEEDCWERCLTNTASLCPLVKDLLAYFGEEASVWPSSNSTPLESFLIAPQIRKVIDKFVLQSMLTIYYFDYEHAGRQIYPRYKIENGCLLVWDPTTKLVAKTIEGNKKVITNYLRTYPEKAETYNSLLDDFKKKIEKIKHLEESTPLLYEKIEELNEKIIENMEKRERIRANMDAISAEISKLQRRILGKKKAEVRIAELNDILADKQKQLQLLDTDTANMTTEQDKLEDQLDQADSFLQEENNRAQPFDERLFQELASAMDYFRVWHLAQ